MLMQHNACLLRSLLVCVELIFKRVSVSTVGCCSNFADRCQDAINTKNKLSKKKINMNYDNYESKIVEKHGIILEGWTYGQVQNPGKIGRREDLVTLLNALVNGRCVWVKLSEQDLEQRMESNRERAKNGESIYKPRKTMKKNPAGAAKSAAVIEDSDVSHDESEEEDEREMQSVQDHGAAVEE